MSIKDWKLKSQNRTFNYYERVEGGEFGHLTIFKKKDSSTINGKNKEGYLVSGFKNGKQILRRVLREKARANRIGLEFMRKH